MTREEIIALAKRHCFGCNAEGDHWHFDDDGIEAFFHAAQRMKPPTPVSTVDFLPHDDYLRFAQRVLEGDAPTESDRKEAARMICDIRRALYIQRGQQAPVEEPELPGPVAARWPSVPGSHQYAGAKGCAPGDFGPNSEDLYTAAQMQAFADAKVRAALATQQTTEEPELPEAVACQWFRDGKMLNVLPHPPGLVDVDGYWLKMGYTSYPLFTTAQMHDHYQAGVRAGMARGQTLQALQRGFEKVLADPEKHGLDLGGQQ